MVEINLNTTTMASVAATDSPNIFNSHHHLICLGCGKVVEFSYDFLNDVKDKIQKENGFNIVDYQLKFYGYCKDCIKKANNNKG